MGNTFLDIHLNFVLKVQEWKSVSCETQSSQRRLSKIYHSVTKDDNPANVNERHKEMLNREKWNSISSLIGTRKYDYNIWMYFILYYIILINLCLFQKCKQNLDSHIHYRLITSQNSYHKRKKHCFL